MATILVTGGAGYIGSHTCVQLLTAGHDVVVVDNLSNSSTVAIDRVRSLADGSLTFNEVDLRDRGALSAVFDRHSVDQVVHFAGLKAVGESVDIPLAYYDNNLAGTVSLLSAMAEHEVFDLAFSSSCTVYGEPEVVPITESAPIGAVSPYGRTKLYIEEMLRDVAAADDRWRTILLRYFNPVGAHPSGTIGEDPTGIPNNLMPFAMQVAVGRLERLRVFGGDYDTPDGTCIRDYIHVVDLADAHLAALGALERIDGCEAVNVGTGTGSSVLEVVAAAGRAVGREIPHEVVERRPGDVPCVFADTARAEDLLRWTARFDLDDMCRDHWNWQRQNPSGYQV
ncbi:UDP-glucose 4-epimerase GalE [Actinospongicola halichondriae]|uniref:UDP-glucose 4-epimerase GalE n=1 Tax=Actinospongicola halichondriae TaxID=3236844 RepID=UPI003D4F2079